MEKYQNKYCYLGIGLAGCYASYLVNGYDAKVSIYDKRLHAYYGDLADGGFVIDKRPAFKKNENAAIHAVISGPIMSLKLSFNTINRNSNNKEEEFNGNFDAIKSFDYVSFDIYCTIWRRLGARIGQRVNKNIVWEDGEIEEILPESERFKSY